MIILIRITKAKGSTPREEGAFMLVSETGTDGTIGGGQLEFMAIDQARAMLQEGLDSTVMTVPLGPEIGQCCGGRVSLSLVRLTPERQRQLEVQLAAEDAAKPAVFIFGAGHVGLALAHALQPLPLRATLIDSRPPSDIPAPAGLSIHLSAMPEAEIARLPQGGAAVILTHDHALDFLIAREALARNDLAYVGMIGSMSKRQTFAHWFTREGGDAKALQRLTMPIGQSPLTDKRPAVIAALVAAELAVRLLRDPTAPCAKYGAQRSL
ncbi:xanthine dehydrogenase accessory protein XdhC [Allorhizobium sp. BGMRC 0089]|uniref:xanthine dehydrogenase accessory protein XdhC n=1 Tax=Allorhizobium sonneratiae TaxID=2934936 RepID=UPI0020345014|nr:xanthine dehydrogenase accessory protein XdhC [Allorhizobium sonneratiae]MCM2291141.1 xanthine dehydrogenase accessory protein XdhC [Allorhizobium sonneratiae]